jgi:DNA repair exonuclease SbcCD ATPase subunit
MAEPSSANTELEQSLYKAVAKAKDSRQRATLAVLVPVLLGLAWLGYSVYEVRKWHSRAATIEQREAAFQQREAQAQARATDAESQRAAAEAQSKAAKDEESRVKTQIAETQKTLLELRASVDNLGTVVNDLTALRSRASLLSNSGALESQIVDVRGVLGRGLAGIEQQIDRALPGVERKPRVHIFIPDEEQRETAKRLKAALEEGGFDVPTIAKQIQRKIDTTEIRFFRNPKDKAEATQLADIVRKQPGIRDVRVSSVDDADNAGAGRKYQLWLGKAAPPVR